MIDVEPISALKIPPWKYKEIESKVVDLYLEQDIRKIPLDPFEILKQRGYVLLPFSKFNSFNYPDVMDDNNDAFSFYSPELKTYIIVYNDNKPLQRIRFTLMHELGHIDLGHKGESELARKMADYYAGYALAPSPLIGFFASDEIFDIISTFWVSLECAEVCSLRYKNWKQFGGRHYKDYELQLLNLFR